MAHVYRVAYTAYGSTLTTVFQDPQEDGISAEQKALDYIDAARRSPPEVRASCVVTRDGTFWKKS